MENGRFNREIIAQSSALVCDFTDSGLAKLIPEDVIYVLVPEDNENLADLNRQAGYRAILGGSNILFIQASRTEGSEHYTDFSFPASDESVSTGA